MKIIDKILAKQNSLHENRQPVIAFLGDSVTQGCFEIYVEQGQLLTAFRAEDGYVTKVKTLLGMLYPAVPVSIINAGISGQNAELGLERLERDVLSYQPDLVVVCFGLNDAAEGADRLPAYEAALKKIFTRIQETGAEVIFMTPNTRSDYTDYHNANETIEQVIRTVSQGERDGLLRLFLDSARRIAGEMNVPVCDCHALWELMRSRGVNTNKLLSNEVNHPTKELHWMFAYELVRTMLER
ncbi:MAG: GDSL family lipase [Clostridia bacterium]|nr:GDSL family lipase [Clostridia bacterium]